MIHAIAQKTVTPSPLMSYLQLSFNLASFTNLVQLVPGGQMRSLALTEARWPSPMSIININNANWTKHHRIMEYTSWRRNEGCRPYWKNDMLWSLQLWRTSLTATSNVAVHTQTHRHTYMYTYGDMYSYTQTQPDTHMYTYTQRDVQSYTYTHRHVWHCRLGTRKSIRPVKIELQGAGMVICLAQNDLPVVQLMLLTPHHLLRH